METFFQKMSWMESLKDERSLTPEGNISSKREYKRIYGAGNLFFYNGEESKKKGGPQKELKNYSMLREGFPLSDLG